MRITSYLTSLIDQAARQLELDPITTLHLEHPAESSHGDYATNVAMVMMGQLGKKTFQNPRQLAQALTTEMTQLIAKETEPLVQSIEVAGPGFINFKLSPHFLLRELEQLVTQPLERPDLHHGQKIIVEFTDPNPFKEFHIGHLFSNAVGESLARLMSATGAQVHRVCYQGDVGMHVAKSVWGLKKLLAEQERTIADLAADSLNLRIKFLGQAYAKGAQAFEVDEVAAQEIKEINFLTFLSAQDNLKETQNWQPQVDYQQYLATTKLDYQEIKALYQQGRTWSLAYFEEIYQKLGTKFDDYFFESVVGEFGVQIVKEFLAKGVFKESQGAIIFPGSEYGLHDRVFINSLGLPTYECKELGLAPEKYRRWPYDQSLIITGNEIKEYFKVLLTALGQTNPELAKKTKHFSHGMVRLPEGKMSSRTGKVLTGEWLLAEAKAKVVEILSTTKNAVPAAEVEATAEKVGIAAIKYALLKSNLGHDIAFSFEESLSFHGNSGPYLQYTVVRCHSLLTKAAESNSTKPFDILLNNKVELGQNLNAEEIDLLRNLYRYYEVVEQSAREYAPHHLATYLYGLAQSFNGFYNQHTVLGPELPPSTRSFRLALTKAVHTLLSDGLQLLGIPTVTQM